MAKFYTIDPETCSKEELENAIDYCKNREEYYHTMEQSCKIYINSMYGAMGSAFYSCANKDIAESITLQGQNLIKFSVKAINDYFNNIWPFDKNAHQKVAAFLKEKHPDFDVDKFLKMSASVQPNIETYQAYGDSVSGDSVLYVNIDGILTQISIEELFKKCITINKPTIRPDGKLQVRCDFQIGNYKNGEFVTSNVNNLISHKVTKEKWIISADGMLVETTCDHSMMVMRNNELVMVKPREIVSSDKVVVCDGVGDAKVVAITECVQCEEGYVNEYVFDVEMDDDSHTFFANGILVHNTDSVTADSVVRTEKHIDGITIEDFYNENIENTGDTTLAGHESVNTDDKVLNWNQYGYYGRVRRIIRHKVSKPKWKMTTKQGRVVECTDNHSLVVFRNGHQVHVTPNEIQKDDKVIILSNGYKFDDIERCECMGSYENEYVYDIEMDDDTHTFICNDILVHNSCYMTIQPLMDLYQMDFKYGTDFILGMYNCILEDYLDMCFNKYAGAFNCPENKQVLELEKTARILLMLAKKNYFMDVSWVDSGAYIEPLHKLNIKGFDIVKGSTPAFCRKAMKEFMNNILGKLVRDEMPSYDYIVGLVRDIKKKFEMQSPNDICKSSNISDMEKCILNDRYDGQNDTGVIYHRDKKNPEKTVTVPIHVRAAATYNYILSSKGRKYMSKYNFIHSKDKVKYYYCEKTPWTTEDNPVFAFFPNEYPIEFAPKMDVDIQFEKTLLSPLNRVVVALGYQEIPSTLTYAASLW